VDALRTAFFQARPEGWAVIAVIVAAFAYCLYRLWCIRHDLAREERDLAAAREATRQHGLAVAASHLSRWLPGADGAVARDTTVAVAVRSVWASRHLAGTDLEAIATLLAQREARRLAAVRAYPNRLMLLGLLGTVIGLAGALTPLAAQMTQIKDATDPTALSQELDKMLRHMNQAFACTAWGIVAAVLSSFGIATVGGRQVALLGDIQDFTLSEFAPVVLPRGQEAHLENIETILRRSQEFLEAVGTRMDNSAKEFSAAIEDAGAAMQRSLTRLNDLAGGVSSTLTTASDNVRRAAETMEGSVGKLAEGTGQLGESQQQLQTAYTQLKELFEATRAQIEEQSRRQLEGIAALQEQQLARLADLHASHLEEGAAFRSAFGEQARSIAGSAAAAATAVEEGAHRFVEIRDAIQTAGLEANQSLRTSVENLQASFRQLLEDHRSEVVTLEGRLRAIDTTLQQLAERLHPANLPREEWAAVSTALQTAARELEAVQSDSWPRALQQGEAIQEAIAQLATRLTGPQPVPPPTNLPPAPAVLPPVPSAVDVDLGPVIQVLQDCLAELRRATALIAAGAGPAEAQTPAPAPAVQTPPSDAALPPPAPALDGDVGPRVLELHRTVHQQGRYIAETLAAIRGELARIATPPPRTPPPPPAPRPTPPTAPEARPPVPPPAPEPPRKWWQRWPFGR